MTELEDDLRAGAMKAYANLIDGPENPFPLNADHRGKFAKVIDDEEKLIVFGKPTLHDELSAGGGNIDDESRMLFAAVLNHTRRLDRMTRRHALVGGRARSA